MTSPDITFIRIPAGTDCSCETQVLPQITHHTRTHAFSCCMLRYNQMLCCRCPPFLSVMRRTSSPSCEEASPLRLRRKTQVVASQSWELFHSKHQGLRSVSLYDKVTSARVWLVLVLMLGVAVKLMYVDRLLSRYPALNSTSLFPVLSCFACCRIAATTLLCRVFSYYRCCRRRPG